MAFFHLKMFEIIATDFIQTLDSISISSTTLSLTEEILLELMQVVRSLCYRLITSGNSIE